MANEDYGSDSRSPKHVTKSQPAGDWNPGNIPDKNKISLQVTSTFPFLNIILYLNLVTNI